MMTEETKAGLVFDLQNLITRSQALDDRLSSCESYLNSHAPYKCVQLDLSHVERRCRGPNIFFNSIAHCYPSLSQAKLWDQYRAVRIALNIIISRAIFRMQAASENSSQPNLNALQDRAQTEIEREVDQLCASVPFFFGLVGPQCPRNPISAECIDLAIKSMTASTALMLVWPMTISSAATEIAVDQGCWIRSLVTLLGKITGNGILEVTAKVGYPQMGMGAGYAYNFCPDGTTESVHAIAGTVEPISSPIDAVIHCRARSKIGTRRERPLFLWQSKTSQETPNHII